MPQKIDVRSVGQIRAAFASHRHAHVAPRLAGAPLTLAAALEVAGWLEDDSHNDSVGRSHLEKLSDGCNALAIARELLRKQGANHAKAASATGTVELSTITELTAADIRWNEFWQRFTSALKAAGFEKSYANALGFALHEMADNVIQHSMVGSASTKRPRSLVGWNVSGAVAAFAVIDLGQGIRKTLTQNPVWKNIATDHDALRSVAVENATRKEGNKFGDGYREVLKNFVNRNGRVCIRSGSAELLATSDGLTPTFLTTPCPEFIGTRVALWCAPFSSTSPEEPTVSA
jgi:hypothetical protein